ncbi:MAG: ankyrin repeat domain-containing protein [Kiritimatiellae bacterium]|nr:ankyrin repeat domain-containing protein [Kiritimatiellia bacterium]
MKTLRHAAAGIACSLVLFGCVTMSKHDLGGVISALERHIDSTLAAKAEAGKFYSEYRIPDDKTLRKIAGRPLSAEELNELQKIAEEKTREAERRIVWPKWIDSIWAKTLSAAEKSLNDGQYEKARESVWRASTTGVAEVDGGVRKLGYEFLNTRVNPAEWKKIERQMRDNALDFANRSAYDEGIEYFKHAAHIREYPLKLDNELDKVKAEVVALSVPEESVDPILAAARDTMEKAQNICDYRDTKTNAVSEVVAGVDAAAYDKAVEDYRKLLLRYNCTKENADKIASALKKDIEALFAGQYGKETTTSGFLYLGTGAVNKRIDKYAGRLSKWLETKRTFAETVEKLLSEGKEDEARKLVREDVEAVAIAPDVETVKTTPGEVKAPSAVELVLEGSRLRCKVKKLVAGSKFAEARELIWSSCYPEKQTVVSLYLQPVGKDLMLTAVNPAHWAEIEAAVTNATAKAIAAGDFTNAISKLLACPRVKTYAGAIDAKLALAAGEARALGVEPGAVAQAVGKTAGSAAEAANLADHTDKIDLEKIPGRSLDFKTFNALVEEFRRTLVRNDCTEENAKRLVEEFKNALEPHFALLQQERSREKFFLGCNALNDRIAKLVEENVARLRKAKREIDGYIEELVGRVAQLVKEGKYAEARNAIRDAKPLDNPVLNAKCYAVRVSLLNIVVNPRQCRALEREIDAKVAALKTAEDYDGLREYVKNYPYVHDAYKQIRAALGQIRQEVENLDIDEKSAEALVDALRPGSLRIRIREMLEVRDANDAAVDMLDLAGLDQAIAALQDGVNRHYDNHGAVEAGGKKFRKEVLDLRARELPPMTTRELNARLKAHLSRSLEGLEKLEYAKRLRAIDEEVSFAAQIAMAEDAISRQIGVVCPCAEFKMNAVMGDYARIARLLERGGAVSEQEATTLLVGAVYLNQPAMFKHALELGAKIDKASDRDPCGRPAMLLAIETGHQQFLSAVNDANGSKSVVDANGNTVLHYAMRSGNLVAVKAVFDMAGAMAVNSKGETALFSAARRRQAAAAKFLIDLVKGTNDVETAALRKRFASVKNKAGDDAFAVACKVQACDVLDVLAAAGAEYAVADLVEAAAADNLAVARWLVSHGVDVNGKGVMKAAFGKADDEDTATYKYLVSQGGIALKRTPKCCKELRAKLAETEKKLAGKEAGKAKVTGTVSFEAVQSK